MNSPNAVSKPKSALELNRMIAGRSQVIISTNLKQAMKELQLPLVTFRRIAS